MSDGAMVYYRLYEVMDDSAMSLAENNDGPSQSAGSS